MNNTYALILFKLLILIYCIQIYKCQTILQLNKPSLPQLLGTTGLRLVQDDRYCKDKRNIIAGRLEVSINGDWDSICSYYWNRHAANVVCRELGYRRAYRYRIMCERPRIRLNQLITRVNCNGEEESIRDCKIDTSFDINCYTRQESVGLSCVTYYSSSETEDFSLHLEKPVYIDTPQLTNSIVKTVHTNCSGLVYLSTYRGQSGYISTIGFDKSDGEVICYQLGLGGYIGQLPDDIIIPFYNQSKLSFPIAMVKPMCKGIESSLSQCKHWGWGSFDHLASNGIVSVMCNCQPNLQCDIPISKSFRLKGSPYTWAGRLEVFRNGEWGRVCPLGFSLDNAHVACKNLGFYRARWVNREHFGDGYGPLWYNQLECKGDENNFDDCKYKLPFQDYSLSTDCAGRYSYFKDTFIKCEVRKPNSLVRVAKRYYKDNCAFIEFEHEGNWYPHCCDNHKLAFYDAKSICRDLFDGSFPKEIGCGYRFDVRVTETLYSLRGNISCKHGTCFGANCKDDSWRVSDTCPDKKYTYVCCSKYLPDVIIDKKELINSLGGLSRRPFTRYISKVRTASISCAIKDNCLGEDADATNRYQLRKLLRFTTKTFNNGRNTFLPPTRSTSWIWHNCHKHFHSIEAYVSYRLLYLNGSIAAMGHKASFCLEDSGCKPNRYRYHICTRNGRGSQGISVGCFDSYRNTLDCQWVDITHVKEGRYSLELIVNPLRLVPESDFANNGIRCDIAINVLHYKLYSCSYFNSEYSYRTSVIL